MDRLIAPTKDDVRVSMKREYRMQQEHHRKQRIFDDRTRLIGIDRQALDDHVHEKQRQKQQEQLMAESYASELRQQNATLNERLKELAAERQRMQQELVDYRQQHQRKDQTRDYDLSDPRQLQRMSAFQGFDWLGEDECHQERRKQQKEQMRTWLQQQMQERQQLQQDRRDAERTMEAAMIRHDSRLQEIDRTERGLRRQMHCHTAGYNRELAKERAMRAEQLRRQDEEDSLAEIVNHLSSDMLLEDKEAATASNLFGGKRICSYMYRGMTDAQSKAIRDEQRQQIEAKKAEAQLCRASDRHCDRIIESSCLELERKEREAQEKRRQANALQNQTNLQLSMEQKQKKQYLKNELYTFQPTDEYFEQFNKTTR